MRVRIGKRGTSVTVGSRWLRVTQHVPHTQRQQTPEEEQLGQERTGKVFIAFFALMGVLALLLFLFYGVQYAKTLLPVQTITYRVTASNGADLVSVAYRDRGEVIDARNAIGDRLLPLPWTVAAAAQWGESIGISAQNRTWGERGLITCELLVNGKVVATHSDPVLVECRP
jgi:hypothetical protein